MDILITNLDRKCLENRISEFINILAGEPNEYWNESHFMLDLPNKYDLSVVVSVEGVTAGYIIASLKEDRPYIHKFMVRKDLRRMKIGEMMLNYFEKNLHKKGFFNIDLTVREENENAIRFYRKKKFVISGSRVDTSNNGLLLMMTKTITQGSVNG